MEAKELMISDYVRHKSTKDIIRIFEIDGDRKVINCASDGCFTLKISINDIEPIPLTREILKKNGFYYDEDRKAYLMGVVFQVKPERHGCFSLNICGCPYPLNTVHELQHALRLGKIEKEIWI